MSTPSPKPARSRLMWASGPSNNCDTVYVNPTGKIKYGHYRVLLLPWTAADREALVERMAKAMWRHDWTNPKVQKIFPFALVSDIFINRARAALAAIAPKGGK